jgi:hypothetical protein
MELFSDGTKDKWESLFKVYKEWKMVSEALKHTYSMKYTYLGACMHVINSIF